MKSGLYACAGASATASAAACAKRFDDPMMKRSNVYFGLSGDSWTSRSVRLPSRSRSSAIAGVLRGGVGAERAGAMEEPDHSPTAKETSSSLPSVSRTAVDTKFWKWLSIQLRVKSFGTATTTPPSSNELGSAWANHVS